MRVLGFEGFEGFEGLGFLYVFVWGEGVEGKVFQGFCGVWVLLRVGFVRLFLERFHRGSRLGGFGAQTGLEFRV